MGLTFLIYVLVFAISFLIFIIDNFLIYYTRSKIFENQIAIISIKKIDFVFKNKIKVHDLFVNSIFSVLSIIKNSNKKIIFQNFFVFLYFIGTVIFLIFGYIYDFYIDPFSSLILVFEVFWIIKFFYLLYFMFSRFAITKKLKIISKELIIKSDINLFDLKIEQKDVLKIEHIGSFENIESDNYFLHSLIFDFSTYKDYKIRKNSDLFKNDKQKFLLNRDLLLYKFNQNKEQARHIHYLMVVYSNYKNEEFYNPNYEDNMRYFLELEKFY